MKLPTVFAVGAAMFLLAGCITSYDGPVVADRPPTPPPDYPRRGPGPVAARPPAAPPRARPRPEPWVDVSITASERQVIQGYVAAYEIERKHPRKGKKPRSLPPGLQKKVERGGSLPPGWEKRFRKGEVLPVEVYRECHPLPQEVMVKLPPQPPGTVLITIGGRVARLLAATREILDVFEVDVEY